MWVAAGERLPVGWGCCLMARARGWHGREKAGSTACFTGAVRSCWDLTSIRLSTTTETRRYKIRRGKQRAALQPQNVPSKQPLGSSPWEAAPPCEAAPAKQPLRSCPCEAAPAKLPLRSCPCDAKLPLRCEAAPAMRSCPAPAKLPLRSCPCEAAPAPPPQPPPCHCSSPFHPAQQPPQQPLPSCPCHRSSAATLPLLCAAATAAPATVSPPPPQS